MYDAIHEMLDYWSMPDPHLEPGPAYDKWRKNNDLDCILARKDPAVTESAILNADMLISLWIPLRMALDYIKPPRWVFWKEYARTVNAGAFMLKRHSPFLQDLGVRIEEYLPAGNKATASLERLFQLGQTKANVMILPDRKMNVRRGRAPYYDYVPHFLVGLYEGDFGGFPEKTITQWIERETLQMFFANEIVEKERVLDLLGTGNPKRHSKKDIVKALPAYLDACCYMLERRKTLLDKSA